MAWTYLTLKQAIQDWTEYSETSFVSSIDTFIRNCEERLFYNVDLDYFRKNSTGVCTTSSKFLAVPSDYLSPFSLAVTVSGTQTFLLNKDVEYLQEYNPTGATGTPKYYALFDINNFILAPVPASNYSVEIHYYYKPESIITAGTTWLGTNAEEAMLFGCLVEAYTYMKAEADMLTQYSQRFVEAVARLKNYGEGRENADAYREGLVRTRVT